MGTGVLEDQLYNERFLLKRALLQAIDHRGDIPPVLLIDEIDRADDEFEAYLLEMLSDYQITIPELGRFTTTRPPIVILTSNRTRDVHDALKRRCLYHWVEHPDFEREVAIVRMRVPNVIEPLARQVAAAVEAMRGLNLYKPPGVAETIDWAQALGRARRDRARRGNGRLHARHRAEVPRGPRTRPPARHRRHGEAGVRARHAATLSPTRLVRRRRRSGWRSPSPGSCVARRCSCRSAAC